MQTNKQTEPKPLTSNDFGLLTPDNDFGFIDFDSIESKGLAEAKDETKETKPETKEETKDGAKPEAKKEEDLNIDPSLVIFIFDSIFVRVVSFAALRFGYEVKPSEISLTKAEINRIKPYAEKSLAKLVTWFTGKFPEHSALLLILAITYGSKILDKSKKIDKSKPKEKPKRTYKSRKITKK